jgi:CubicO group peptidase (beta-lactamase class C family)
MSNVIRYSGSYGYLLALMAVVVVVLSLRGIAHLLRHSDGTGPGPDERLNALLFWGFASGVLGFLGQCYGVFLALGEIRSAPEISPHVVAEGFVISFVPSLFGLGIMAFSLFAWSCLRLLSLGGRRQLASGVPILLLSLLTPLAFVGCSPGQERPLPMALTEGLWALDAGPDRFLWEFSTRDGGLVCMVHDLQGPRKFNETPCRSATSWGDSVRVSMDTGVILEGEIRLDSGRLSGQLIYPDGSHREADLLWSLREEFPALLARGGGAVPYEYRVPGAGNDGWEASPADAEGVDSGVLEELVGAIADRGEAGILHSLLLARNGRLILEEYFHGYTSADPHHLASCTKSVSSLLVGAAIREGAIAGVTTPLPDFFPGRDYVFGAGWERLTLHHLLTMSMALDWSPEEAGNLHGTGPEFFQRIFDRSVSGSPGQDWAYVSANMNLLAGILKQATGEHAEVFADRVLFKPMGIDGWDWRGWKTEGYNLMDGSLRLRPRDMAKIGQMVLEGGVWKGNRILDEEWIRVSTTPQVQTDEAGMEYGYLWWFANAPGPGDTRVPVIFANGWGSQFIALIPSLDLVVVTTGGNEYNGKHMAFAELLAGTLLPGVRSE